MSQLQLLPQPLPPGARTDLRIAARRNLADAVAIHPLAALAVLMTSELIATELAGLTGDSMHDPAAR